MRIKPIILILIVTAAFACGREDDPLTRTRRRPQPVEIEEPEEIVIPEYSYEGDALRSPFSPVAARRRPDVGVEDERLLEELNLENLKVTAFISDPDRKYAVLSGPAEYYIIRDGRLLDEDDRQVSGVAAVISEDKVTLITEAEETIEIQAPQW